MPIADRERHAERSVRRYTNAECIRMLREDTEALGRVPGCDSWCSQDDRPAERTIRTRFGSWNGFVRAAGYEPRAPSCVDPSPLKWPAAEILRLAREDQTADGFGPTMQEWRSRPDRPDPGSVVARFGSWAALMRAVGAKTRPPGGALDAVPNDALREAVRASGIPLARIASDIGYMRRKRGGLRGDDRRLRRALGIYTATSHGRRYVQRSLSYNVALRIAQAIGADPREVGL